MSSKTGRRNVFSSNQSKGWGKVIVFHPTIEIRERLEQTAREEERSLNMTMIRLLKEAFSIRDNNKTVSA